MTNLITKAFLTMYDTAENLQFDTCRYRPKAPFTAPFGLDWTFGTLRTHMGVDRGYSSSSGYLIFAPFNFEYVSYINPYSSFGSLLFLPVKNTDFALRIAHMELTDISVYYRTNLQSGKMIEIYKNEIIGEAGNKGLSVGIEIVKGKKGAHTHTEIVSDGKCSTILESILTLKVPREELEKEYTEEDIAISAKEHDTSVNEALKQYEKEREKRKIIFLNKYKCVRTDYHTNRLATFYNSVPIFGF